MKRCASGTPSDRALSPQTSRVCAWGSWGSVSKAKTPCVSWKSEGAAAITVFERRSFDELQDEQATLVDDRIGLLPDTPEALAALHLDALFVSQGILDNHPLVASAHTQGLPISATMRLFLRRCPVPVIGITGSAGKTTYHHPWFIGSCRQRA